MHILYMLLLDRSVQCKVFFFSPQGLNRFFQIKFPSFHVLCGSDIIKLMLPSLYLTGQRKCKIPSSHLSWSGQSTGSNGQVICRQLVFHCASLKRSRDKGSFNEVYAPVSRESVFFFFNLFGFRLSKCLRGKPNCLDRGR